jgi:hypothetical protein
MDVLPATLHLRGAGADEAGPLRILWPRQTMTKAVAVVAGDRKSVPVVATAIAASGAIAVLLPAAAPPTVRAVCGWFADHAAELGADPLSLTLVTIGLSYDAALALADSVTDDDWPPVDVLIGLPDPPTDVRKPPQVRSLTVAAAESLPALGESAVDWMQRRR